MKCHASNRNDGSILQNATAKISLPDCKRNRLIIKLILYDGEGKAAEDVISYGRWIDLATASWLPVVLIVIIIITTVDGDNKTHKYERIISFANIFSVARGHL